MDRLNGAWGNDGGDDGSSNNKNISNNNNNTGYYHHNDPWKDLQPHRSTAAILGILSIKDCRDTSDLWRAEEQLLQWARRYSHPSDRESIALGANDDRSILLRLFVFDSFEEHTNVDLNKTRFRSSQLVAFPPLLSSLEGSSSRMMGLHWNVVVNDLAVALFRNVERKIRANDEARMNWSGSSSGKESMGKSISSSTTSGELGMEDGSHLGGGGSTVISSGVSSQESGMEESSSRSSVTTGVGGRFKNALDMTRKAITANRQELGKPSDGSGGRFGSSSAARLVTPLDLDANDTVTFSSRDMEALKRRDAGRREKRSADLSLLAGSPIDAYERYTRAAELTRHSHDPLWYASALEGCAVR